MQNPSIVVGPPSCRSIRKAFLSPQACGSPLIRYKVHDIMYDLEEGHHTEAIYIRALLPWPSRTSHRFLARATTKIPTKCNVLINKLR